MTEVGTSARVVVRFEVGLKSQFSITFITTSLDRKKRSKRQRDGSEIKRDEKRDGS